MLSNVNCGLSIAKHALSLYVEVDHAYAQPRGPQFCTSRFVTEVCGCLLNVPDEEMWDVWLKKCVEDVSLLRGEFGIHKVDCWNECCGNVFLAGTSQGEILEKVGTVQPEEQ